MSDHKTIVAGTGGFKPSLLTVECTASTAAALDATLVTGCTYYEIVEDTSKALHQDSAQVLGDGSAQKNLAATKEAVGAAGTTRVETEVRSDPPVETLISSITDRRADLLVVGNRSTNSLTGRLLDSVSVDVTCQSNYDVMIAHAMS